jgi:hypothetical protein
VPSPSRSSARSPALSRTPSGTAINVAVPTRIGALGTTSPGITSPPSSVGGVNIAPSPCDPNQYRPFAIPYPPQAGASLGRAISPFNPTGSKKLETESVGKSFLASSDFPKDKKEPRLDEEPVVLGICAMDIKARSKAMREILTRLVQIEKGGVVVKLFGDMVILEEGMSRLLLRDSRHILLTVPLDSCRHHPLASRRRPNLVLFDRFPSS